VKPNEVIKKLSLALSLNRDDIKKIFEAVEFEIDDDRLDAILARHQAKAIIVGHTVTGAIGWLDGDKRLIGIDVHWDTLGEGEGLLIVGDKLSRLTMSDSNLELEHISTIPCKVDMQTP